MAVEQGVEREVGGTADDVATWELRLQLRDRIEMVLLILMDFQTEGEEENVSVSKRWK